MLNANGFRALILAAGFGTRLLPYTKVIPKPLFPIAGRPILDRIIDQLISAGCTGIAVNSHHLPDQIAGFLDSRNYPVPVIHRYEPHLLGTGGAILNFGDFLGREPFVVINADILTDLDISSVVQHHLSHPYPATLVMHDCPQFNKVCVNSCGLITGFSKSEGASDCRHLAFTGVQVLDADISDYIRPGIFDSSIDAYTRMIRDGKGIKAYFVSGHYWNDLGTPQRYRDGVLHALAPAVFEKAFGRPPERPFTQTLLAGDGSDRQWLRIRAGEMSLIAADHGIQTDPHVTEIDAFVAIGTHFLKKGVPVAPIYAHDRFAGLVFLADLGDTLLYDIISATEDDAPVMRHYQAVIDRLAHLGISGAEDFDPVWTYQSAVYDKTLIIEKEGLYFTRALLKDYLGMKDLDEDRLAAEFSKLADAIGAYSVMGLMHRDMQSRNIMVTTTGEHHFIDYQAARLGPLQYDLAALLLDPYASLPESMQEDLLGYALDQYAAHLSFDRNAFAAGYRCCAVSRTLQALGAYGFLAGVKKKTRFAKYIPAALKTLRKALAHDDVPSMPYLKEVVDRTGGMIKDNGC